jgi:hypothetical protein
MAAFAATTYYSARLQGVKSSSASSRRRKVGPPGTKGGDCDDTDPNVNPGVVEGTVQRNCADGIDNDSKGKTDSADPGCATGPCARGA